MSATALCERFHLPYVESIERVEMLRKLDILDLIAYCLKNGETDEITRILSPRRELLLGKFKFDSGGTFITLSSFIYSAADKGEVLLVNTLAKEFSLTPQPFNYSWQTWINSIIVNRRNLTRTAFMTAVGLGATFDESTLRDCVYYTNGELDDLIYTYGFASTSEYLTSDDLFIIAANYQKLEIFHKLLKLRLDEISNANLIFRALIMSNFTDNTLTTFAERINHLNKVRPESSVRLDIRSLFMFAVDAKRYDRLEILNTIERQSIPFYEHILQELTILEEEQAVETLNKILQ